MIIDDYSKSLKNGAEDLYSLGFEITTKVKETEDSFIFETLNNFAQEHYQISVEKEELIKSIQLIRMFKEYGRNIDERWTTATQQSAYLSDAYRRGFQDGIEKERNRLIDILENKKKGES